MAVSTAIPELDGGGFFTVDIRCECSWLKVWLDDVRVSSHLIDYVPSFLQPTALVGFTATTGAKTNYHIIDHAVIGPICDLPDVEGSAGRRPR